MTRYYQIINNNLVMSEGQLNLFSSNSTDTKMIPIQVKAIGCNRADIIQLKGNYDSPDDSNIPGLEVAGIRLDNGKSVCALLTSGGYSELVMAPENCVLDIPDQIVNSSSKIQGFIQAASVVEAFATVWLNFSMIGQLSLLQNQNEELPELRKKTNNLLIIHGAASGIGSIAVQYGLSLGYNIIATSRDANKLNQWYEKITELLKNKKKFDETQSQLEAKIYPITCDEDFSSLAKKIGGAEMILDILGGSYLEQNLEALQNGGKLISIGYMGGSQGSISMAKILHRNLSIHGSTLRNKSLATKGLIIENIRQHLLPLWLNGSITPIIDSVYDFKDAAKALAKMQNNSHIGKIVLTCNN